MLIKAIIAIVLCLSAGGIGATACPERTLPATSPVYWSYALVPFSSS